MTFALSGCIDDKNNSQEVEEVTTSPLLNLTQEQQENYYNQYLAILEEIRMMYPSADMVITPIEAYEGQWLEPEEFKNSIIDFLENGVTYSKEELAQQTNF